MNLQEIREALRDTLNAVDGVRGYDYVPGTLVTSSAGATAVVVAAPPDGPYVEYLHASMGGQVRVNFELRVYVQLVDMPSAQRRLDELLSAGTGETKSLFDGIRVDASLNGTVMDCTVQEASGHEKVTVGEADYLSAVLSVLVLTQRI